MLKRAREFGNTEPVGEISSNGERSSNGIQPIPLQAPQKDYSASAKLFQFLEMKPNLPQFKLENAWIEEIENRRKSLTPPEITCSDPDTLLQHATGAGVGASTNGNSTLTLEARIGRLQTCRARISNSLSRSPADVHRWNSAQKLIESWIDDELSVELKDLLQLNSVLTGEPQSSWRTVDIYTTQVKHLPPDEIPSAMERFWRNFQNSSKTQHPLRVAFMSRYYFISIHPFREANGRTSQLLADYFLLKHDYLPQAFVSKTDAFLIGDPEKKAYMTPHEAFRRFCNSVRNAYDVLES